MLISLSQLYTWGYGLNGRLGHGDDENSSVPRLVEAFKGMKVTMVAGGLDHTLVLTED